MIGASVTDPGRLEQVPADRPAVIVAERLLPYLEESDVWRLLLRLTDRFGLGELLFDGLAPRLTRLPGPFRWGIRDPRQIERWNPRLHLAARVPFATHFAWIPVRDYRVLYRGDERHPRPAEHVSGAPVHVLSRLPSRGRPAWTNDGSQPASCGDRQAAGWLKVATSRPNASMWSLIEKATTAPRVVAGRPRLGTSSANTDNL
jgi:hypothetical protein